MNAVTPQTSLAVGANGENLPIVADRAPYGGEFDSVDTNVHRLFAFPTGTTTPITNADLTGTNAAAKVAGGERENLFTLTGINNSGGTMNFAGWILEITQATYTQKVYIKSNSTANPSVATIEVNPEAKQSSISGQFNPALPAGGNVTYIIYPVLLAPLTITLDNGAASTLTILNGNSNVPVHTIAVLDAGESITLPVSDMSKIYYRFGSNAATEILRWAEGCIPSQM